MYCSVPCLSEPLQAQVAGDDASVYIALQGRRGQLVAGDGASVKFCFAGTNY